MITWILYRNIAWSNRVNVKNCREKKKEKMDEDWAHKRILIRRHHQPTIVYSAICFALQEVSPRNIYFTLGIFLFGAKDINTSGIHRVSSLYYLLLWKCNSTQIYDIRTTFIWRELSQLKVSRHVLIHQPSLHRSSWKVNNITCDMANPIGYENKHISTS